jgi:hypothetical protein
MWHSQTRQRRAPEGLDPITDKVKRSADPYRNGRVISYLIFLLLLSFAHTAPASHRLCGKNDEVGLVSRCGGVQRRLQDGLTMFLRCAYFTASPECPGDGGSCETSGEDQG